MQHFPKKSMFELNRLSAEDAKVMTQFPIALVLDNVRSMHNVGSVFRTADSFGLEQIFLCGFTPKPPHREIHKTALGATDTVQWHYNDNIVDALLGLKEQGYKIIAAEQTHNSISLEKIDSSSTQKIAVIFGNEVEGVSDEALALCDDVLEIPQFGTKHSLNISVSVGIVIWELVRRQQP